jgi:hypothetical protein
MTFLPESADQILEDQTYIGYYNLDGLKSRLSRTPRRWGCDIDKPIVDGDTPPCKAICQAADW